VFDALRRRQARPQAVALEAVPAGNAGDGPGIPTERAALWSEVIEAMENLAPVDRDIIALRFGAGQTNRAIAGQLGLTEANVAQRLRRALLALRRAVDEKAMP
jgi:RNA polymerase sigma-70 factor, ECF subfamily